MSGETAYDRGYASVERTARAGTGGLGAAGDSPRFGTSPLWGPATLRLHLGWLSVQLRIDPEDEFRHGRYDALSDLLVQYEPLPREGYANPLLGLIGDWRKAD